MPVQEGRAGVSGARRPSPVGNPVDGVFVLGADDSGADVVHALLSCLGLHTSVADQAREALAESDDGPWRRASSVGGPVPKVAAMRSGSVLGTSAPRPEAVPRDEGRFIERLGPWVSADPETVPGLVLGADLADHDVAVVLVGNRGPGVSGDRGSIPISSDASAPSSGGRLQPGRGGALLGSPSLVVSYEELIAEPKANASNW